MANHFGVDIEIPDLDPAPSTAVAVGLRYDNAGAGLPKTEPDKT
jgi:hypothetical protein